MMQTFWERAGIDEVRRQQARKLWLDLFPLDVVCALLRISQPQRGTLPTAVLGDSDRVRIGEEVLAIGNPFRLDQSVTHGVASALNRILPETPFALEEPLIQTDAPVNPGNSGVPLPNRGGEVIGISTAIIADAANIGFAIPVNLAKAVLPSLLDHGRVIRPWIGFHRQLIDGGPLDLLRIPLAGGPRVEAVEPDSPADHAGLRGGQLEVAIAERDFLIGGDIVLSLNDIRLDTPEDLNNKVSRDGKEMADSARRRRLPAGSSTAQPRNIGRCEGGKSVQGQAELYEARCNQALSHGLMGEDRRFRSAPAQSAPWSCSPCGVHPAFACERLDKRRVPVSSYSPRLAGHRGRPPLDSGAGDQLLDHLLNHTVCPLPHFLGGQVLHRMRHANDLEPWHAKGLRLCLRGIEKNLRRENGSRNLALFKGNPVVHTARRARPSVGERLNNHVAAVGQLLAQ